MRQLLLNRGLPSPVVGVDFSAGAYPSVSGTPRAATDFLDGTTIGVYAEAAGTNYVYDSEMSTTGGPSGLPTFWSTNNSISGIAASKVSQDSTGTTYRFQGTAGATGDYLLTMGSPTTTVAATSDVFTASVDVQQVSASGITANGTFIIERDGAGTFVNMVKSARTFQTDTTFPEVQTKTIVAGPRVTMGVYFTATSGAAVDVTYKFKSPQLEKAAYPSSKIATPSNATASRSADALTAGATSTATHFISAQPSTFTGAGSLLQIDDGSDTNRIELYTTGFKLFCKVVKGGVQDSNTAVGRILPLVTSKLGISTANGCVIFSLNGKPATTVVLPAAFPVVSRAQLGLGATGAWGGVLTAYKQYGTSFAAEKLRANSLPSGLYDDFDRAQGPILLPPTGQAYVQAQPWPQGPVVANNFAAIDSSKFLATADSGTTVTASYNCVDLGAAPSRFAAAIAIDSGTATTANATLVATARGMSKVENITDGAVHVAFTDVNAQVQGFPGGSFTVYGSFTYSTSWTMDGSTIYNIGWRRVGNGYTVLMPDGTYKRVVAAALSSEIGRFAISESYWQGATAPAAALAARTKFAAVAAY